MSLVFSRLVKLKKELIKLCSAVNDLEPMKLTDNEWSLMEGTCKVLVTIKGICDTLEGSKYPTVALLLPLVDTLGSILQGMRPTILDVGPLPAEVQQLCSALHSNIDTRSASFAPEWVCASVMLDLRLRNKMIVCEEMKNMSEASLRSLYHSFDAKKVFGTLEPDDNGVVPNQQPAYNPAAAAAAAPAPAPAAPVHKNITDLINCELVCNSATQSEIEKFLSIQKGLPYDNDPLSWWKEHQHEYPKISMMARVFLSVPASTAASERVFSYGSITLQQRRHSLHIDRVAALMWMMKNMPLYKKLSKTSLSI